jgi:hypothetical protein
MARNNRIALPPLRDIPASKADIHLRALALFGRT